MDSIGGRALQGIAAMKEFVVRQNIEHYRKLLEAETDPAKAEVLRNLLATEKAKLAAPKAGEKQAQCTAP
jgi:hypothetical protein